MKESNRIRNTTGLALLAGALATVLLCGACAEQTDPNSHSQEELNTLRALVVPADALITSDSGPKVGAYSVTAEWGFETKQDANLYFSWAKGNLDGDHFIVRSSDASGFDLSRSFRDETQYVKIQATPSGERLRVSVNVSIDSD